MPRRLQNYVVLLASLGFYASWNWRYLGILLTIATTDFYVARGLDTTRSARRRPLLLSVSLLSNLGALVYFKYSNFFLSDFVKLLQKVGFTVSTPTLRVILPLGISFYTFQALSYTIDVYRRKIESTKSLTEYLCFITFFPHIIAGPIQRAVHLLVQFRQPRDFDASAAVDGMRQMLWGFFKKMVIADNLSVLVARAYAHPAQMSGWGLLWATYLFAIQIYCDFSGYTDIAIGCARLFNIHLTRNFAYPYFSRNIREFWHRWHIALTTWFREYLYIPLGGSQHGQLRTTLNIFVVFVVSGLWHGANWTFVAWGALHGISYCAHDLLVRNRDAEVNAATATRPRQLVDLVRIFVTFNLVCAGWVFFRASTVHDATLILRRIVSDAGSFALPPRNLLFGIAVMLGVEWWRRNREHGLAVDGGWRSLRWASYYTLILAVILYTPLEYRPFIYFQF